MTRSSERSRHCFRWTATLAVVAGVFVASSAGVAMAQQSCAGDLECDDRNACTDDACVAGTCESANNTAPCDDGLFCTLTDTCSGGFCVGAGDPCLALAQVCDATQSACVDTLATLTVHNLYMYPGTTADLVVSGQVAGYDAYSVEALLAILPQSQWGLAGTGSVGFTPAPPTDIVQLGDPWLGAGVFEPHDTDDMAPDNTMNYALIYDVSVYDPSYVPSSPLFSGPLMRFPVTASVDAHGAWFVWQLMSDWYPQGVSALPFDGMITVFPENCVADLDCDDGVHCNGAETCAAGRCQPGAPVVCDDGVPCTLDTCSYLYGGDACIHMPIDERCDNGTFCDGAETCDVVLGCLPGDDPCPDQLCDEGFPACVDCFSDADCGDSVFCNGSELCIDGGCGTGSDPCPGEDCDEVGDVCVAMFCDEDGMCELGEDCVTCPTDCFSGGPACGNGVCEIADGEDCLSCPDDCNGKQGGKPRRRYCCGAGGGENPIGCGDARCSGDGNTCTDVPTLVTCCGDDACDGGEDTINCGVDCGPNACGDGYCDLNEDQCNCAYDCGEPPTWEIDCADGMDEDCDGRVDCGDSDCNGDASCSCLPRRGTCSFDNECCSGKCRRGACQR